MKILYFGTICNIDSYEKLMIDAKERPSIAPIIFESALMNGFSRNNADVNIYSYPMIPAFPKSRTIGWLNKKDKEQNGYVYNWLDTINIPVLKQLSRSLSCRRVLKKWLPNNPNGIVLLYGVAPFIVNNVIKYCKKYNVKCFSVIADLPRDMYISLKQGGGKAQIRQLYLNHAIKNQGKFDGYIYLTEAMKDVINPEAKYMVMEGIADIEHLEPKMNIAKAQKRVIMYAGSLHEKFGIINLVEAFIRIDDQEIELWLFGSGNCEGKLKEYAKKYPRIKFRGNRSHDEILYYERLATLLVNVRSTKEEFTKYSFPSKTIEYMLSGTPVLSTRLKGIPEEYFKYIFSVSDNSVGELIDTLNYIFKYSDEQLIEMGSLARTFIIENKNAYIQSKRILSFLEMCN